MNSVWIAEVVAVAKKEARLDLRDPGSFLTVALFSVVTIFAISVAGFNQELRGGIASGLLWIALLFSAVIGQPRRFLIEEDQQTGDLLRLIARPHAVYWGKFVIGLLEMVITAVAISVLFFLLTSAQLKIPALYALALTGSVLALTGATTISGALAAAGGSVLALTGATTISGALAAAGRNRSTLAAVVSLPLLVPILFFGVSGLRASMGEGLVENAWPAAWGLLGYGIASVISGPWIYASVWKR